MSNAHAAHGHEHNEMAHVAPIKVLVGVFLALIVFTALTVWAAHLDFGAVDLWVAMIIATIKATLVGLYFMHLRYDSAFNRVVFLSAFLFVSIFIGFSLMDTMSYQPDVNWHETLLQK